MDTEARIAAIIAECDKLEPGVRVSTQSIVCRVTFDDKERAALYKLLRTLPPALAPYWTRGAAKKSHYGKTIRPYLWHTAKIPCPTCGGSGCVDSVTRNVQDQPASGPIEPDWAV